MLQCYSQPTESDSEFEAPEPKSVGRGAGRRQKNAADGETTMVSLLVFIYVFQFLKLHYQNAGKVNFDFRFFVYHSVQHLEYASSGINSL